MPLARQLLRSSLLIGLPALFVAAPFAYSQESSPTAKSALKPVLQTFVDKHLVAGAVGLVAGKAGVWEVDAVGEADMVTHQPMPENAVFWIASMSKSLTGAALMMLVDEGKVNLDDPVEKYLPEFKGQQVVEKDGSLHPPKHPITVREIMDHTSGLVKANDKALKRTQSLKENVAQYAKLPLRQEPGTKFEYNNCGINTGGRIIEVASGMSYAEFMQKRLLGPLGMKDTTFWPDAEQAARLAHTARRNPEKPDLNVLEQLTQDKNVSAQVIEKWTEGVPVPAAITADMGAGMAMDYAKHYGEPAGGFFSTARDIGAFCQMLLNQGVYHSQRLLSEKAVRTLSSIQTGEVPVNPQEGYGVGVFVKIRDDEGESVGSFGHRGARRTVMWVDPSNGLVLVLLFERFDMKGDEQKEVYGTFFKAAVKTYGKHQ
ncbi:MAG TPA: serine hydrolase domain-containing protein [Terriglobales bacterium]|nr:serine hydrolase domain-containing protein [Terriglobales bacterium]